MRTFNITHCNDGSYISGVTNTFTLKWIQKELGLRKLSKAYLSKKDVDSLFFLHLEDYLK